MAPIAKALFQPSPRLSLRRASVADLEAMLEIALAALPMDPQWDYRFPHRRAYPSDTRKYTRMRYREFLEDQNERWVVMLAEHRPAQDSREPVAFAVWEIKNIRKQKTVQIQLEKNLNVLHRPPFRQRRRDGDCKRMQAWTDTTSASKKLLFDSQFGASHFQLQILATHPEFQRRGAGGQLVGWGIQLAQCLNMAISVFASPMGERLYLRLGFVSVASVFVNVEKELESVVLAAMVYVPSGSSRPSSRKDAPMATEMSLIRLVRLPIQTRSAQGSFQGPASGAKTRENLDDIGGACPA
ncbi:uncharacterized protein BDZ99DRAFT_482196 [Mytilinidion resinicola]|uniref:N-acetyltransferase domain-containing protein n=1 Tax=Mytilinidion resinicola TaxID=574789 RepID=A0A6A6Y3Z3_9PEZI|nr:uncharacterized protein BDZ99DRAFT_482196 [Mytilinidion resinicola]KAF2803349.1 hypothetical protein BDZ99DRAFT_482196 [Mytilinidion resinicola]